MCAGEILATKQKEDTKKRQRFSELKAQMEHEMKVSVLFSSVQFSVFYHCVLNTVHL